MCGGRLHLGGESIAPTNSLIRRDGSCPLREGHSKADVYDRSERAAIAPLGHSQQPADLEEPTGCAHQRTCVAQGRTRIIVFPLRRSVEFKAATASSRV